LIVFSQAASAVDFGNCAGIADGRNRLEFFARLAIDSRDKWDDARVGADIRHLT
jgi:hypothetical protein